MTNLLLAQVEEMAVHQSTKSVFSLLGSADPLVKLTVFVLLAFSVISWAIVLYKWFQLRRVHKSCQAFWVAFGRSNSLTELSKSQIPHHGSLFEIFNGTLEYYSRMKSKYTNSSTLLQFIEQRIFQLRESHILKLEQYTSFLATAASTAPFIGLFGTVWGILTAFWAIGEQGSSSLATVGPHISEALIVTALGLLVAIPSVLAFNYFTRRIKVLVKLMNLFSNEFLLKLKEELIR